MTRFIPRPRIFLFLAGLVIGCCAVIAQSQRQDEKLDTELLVNAPTVPQMVVDSDGTLHFGPRTVPMPALASPEAKRAYIAWAVQRAQASAARGGLASVRITEGNVAEVPPEPALKVAALKIYPVLEEKQTIAGVEITVYSPKMLPAKNRHKVVMEFQMAVEAISIASLGQLKVIHFDTAGPSYRDRGGPAGIPAIVDIVTVYRELLKTYKPKNIGMFGASSGCRLAQATVMWLPEQKLPFPGAVGLNSCAGGSNPGDVRNTLNGLDPALSTALQPPSGGRNSGGRNAAPRKPGDPPATPLDGEVAKGYPPAFLIAGTRDMCLSETVLLHRKLRNAGIEADLNVFEGMWHYFWQYPELPESREAMAAEANFFNRHLK
jgi:epsilon-lactone hydrolase